VKQESSRFPKPQQAGLDENEPRRASQFDPVMTRKRKRQIMEPVGLFPDSSKMCGHKIASGQRKLTTKSAPNNKACNNNNEIRTAF
jgi:ABC-type antimicrobial peptide transport system ATPase subunit